MQTQELQHGQLGTAAMLSPVTGRMPQQSKLHRCVSWCHIPGAMPVRLLNDASPLLLAAAPPLLLLAPGALGGSPVPPGLVLLDGLARKLRSYRSETPPADDLEGLSSTDDLQQQTVRAMFG